MGIAYINVNMIEGVSGIGKLTQSNVNVIVGEPGIGNVAYCNVNVIVGMSGNAPRFGLFLDLGI